MSRLFVFCVDGWRGTFNLFLLILWLTIIDAKFLRYLLEGDCKKACVFSVSYCLSRMSNAVGSSLVSNRLQKMCHLCVVPRGHAFDNTLTLNFSNYVMLTPLIRTACCYGHFRNGNRRYCLSLNPSHFLSLQNWVLFYHWAATGYQSCSTMVLALLYL